jgi:hypothetical protein
MFWSLLTALTALVLLALVLPKVMDADKGKTGKVVSITWKVIAFGLVAIAFFNVFEVLMFFIRFILALLVDAVILMAFIGLVVFIVNKIRGHRDRSDMK